VPSIAYLTDDEIRQVAEDLLVHYSSALIPVPVPIEEIVEIHLRLEIIPFRAYKQRFSADGSISTDLTNITVDEEAMNRYPSRYRFTLAHEVGHLLLHRDYIQSLAHDEVADWKASLLGTTPTDRSRMEYQASQFAGCLLVPREPLATAFEEARQLLEKRGFDIAELSDIAMDTISGAIAKQFEVSTQVVSIRLKKEGFVTT
jgi:hypothetical protein